MILVRYINLNTLILRASHEQGCSKIKFYTVKRKNVQLQISRKKNASKLITKSINKENQKQPLYKYYRQKKFYKIWTWANNHFYDEEEKVLGIKS